MESKERSAMTETLSGKQYRMVIDVDLCEDCGTCYLACKDEFCDNEFPGYSARQPKHAHKWIAHPRKEHAQGSLMEIKYRPHICMHCADAPCASAAQNGAVRIRPDGIVLIDPEKAKGQKHLVQACPYGAISWNEEAKLPQKCTLCAHLLDEGWRTTRCAQVCPTGALRLVSGDAREIERLIQEENLEPCNPHLKTSPRTLYRNLGSFTRAFIAGSVAMNRNGRMDCVEKAAVALHKEETVLARTVTDNFGDFKFAGLEENSGSYRIRIDAAEEGKAEIPVTLNKSVYLDNIVL
jgi:Fe-S-cluster-containing dehydrogenase component